MKQQVKNFGRFYATFQKMKLHGDPDEIKKQLVLQYTCGRTESLREMTSSEYNELCVSIENMSGGREELRRQRSIVLKLMQELHVDTTDWVQINEFCRNPRISGKSFRELTAVDLKEVAVRLRAIKRKDWDRVAKTESKAQKPVTYQIKIPGYSGICLN